MPHVPRLLTAAAAASMLLTGGLATASTAAAKGGKAPAPAPVFAPLDCFGDYGDPTIPNMTEPDVAVSYAGNAGCVGVRQVGGQLSVAFVVVAPGWSSVVLSNGGGSNSRVQLQFTNSATGARVEFRYEFGKTVIG